MKRRHFLATTAALTTTGAWSQVRPDFATLVNNLPQMLTEVTVNKPVYLVGEELRITLTVTNPTNRQLTVFRPFIGQTGTVTIEPLDDNGDMIPGRSTPISQIPLEEADYATFPVDVFAPGQVRTFSFGSSDDLSYFNQMGLPSQPGRYGVYYSYQSALARFRYVRPVIEQIAQARYPADRLVPGDDLGSPAETVAVFRVAFALRYDNVSYLCAMRDGSESFQLPSRPDFVGPLSPHLVSYLKPYKIVGTSTASVISLAATMDNAENFTILYATSAGGPQTRIDVDTNLNPR